MSLEANPELPDASASSANRRELTMWLIGAAVAIAALLGAVVAMGGRIESATWGLVVAAGAMVFALRALYRMAVALAQPTVEAVLEQEGTAASVSVRELREERRRVLRAINELQFDYEMGKLSEADYQHVRQGYELRAVEVMRALDSESTLHPELQALLRERGLLPAEHETAVAKPEADAAAEETGASMPMDEAEADEVDEEAVAATSEADEETVTEDAESKSTASELSCDDCGGSNDPDAKFCKHCGAAIAQATSKAAGEGGA